MSRKELVITSAEKVAAVIGVEPQTLARNDRGLVLSPNQIELLFTAIGAQSRQMGFQNAIDVLKANGETANIEGPDRNLTQWAVMVSAASFLEGLADKTKPALTQEEIDANLKAAMAGTAVNCKCDETFQCGLCSTGDPNGQKFHWGRA